MMKRSLQNLKLRNIAIIAHVDHGKTTLVDHMFKQSGVFRPGQEVVERVMDSMDLERERGITIAAKNCSVYWQDVKINILDTPGHADFGGEVERALLMVDGALLLVDASEGPLPQTRFVLKKALEAGLKIIVVINKIDRKDARPQEVLNEIYDLFFDLDATEEQIDFPILYAIGREGIAQKTADEQGQDLTPLFQAILDEIPPPTYDPDEPFQMLVADLDYSDYLGRLAVGKVFHGTARRNEDLVCLNGEGKTIPLRISKLQVYDGINLKEVESAQAGDIIILAGIEDVEIGDTICTREAPKALPRISVDEPTISMLFASNTSPLSGTEGKHVQSGKIRERLYKESLRNVAIRVEDGEDADSFIVKGRGEFQMAILIETMRREGFELMVGRPQVIYRQKGDKILEPIEHLFIDCDENFIGVSLRDTLPAEGADGEPGEPRERPCPHGVHHPFALPDWLPQRIPDRHQRNGDHELLPERLRGVPRGFPGAHDRIPGLRPLGRGRILCALQPGAPGCPLSEARRAGLRGDDHRGAQPGERHQCQPL